MEKIFPAAVHCVSEEASLVELLCRHFVLKKFKKNCDHSEFLQTEFVFHSVHSHKKNLKIGLPCRTLRCHYPLIRYRSTRLGIILI